MFIEGEESRSNRAKTASVRIPAKDRRKPVMAILHDHLEVPSIVTCSDCSRLSICVSGSTLKVRLATTCKKDYHLVCVYVCVCVEVPAAIATCRGFTHGFGWTSNL